jgi:hypothetical protein
LIRTTASPMRSSAPPPTRLLTTISGSGGPHLSGVFRPPPQPPVEARRADQGHPAIPDDDAAGRAEGVQVRAPSAPRSWCRGM